MRSRGRMEARYVLHSTGLRTAPDARTRLKCLRAVQRLVDLRRDRLNLRLKFLLNLVQVEAVVVRDEVDCNAEVAKAARAADTVKVRLRVPREVEVDDNVDRLDVNTTVNRSDDTRLRHPPWRKSWNTRLR